MRASLYIQGRAGERIVIDTGPEFRLQAIRAGITRLDAVLLTHAHADHLHGLDDIRPLSYQSPLPVYGNETTIREMKERFSYVFKETQRGGGKPRILPGVISGPLQIGHISLIPVPVKHGMLDILGWKIREDPPGSGLGEAVYLTDTSSIPASSLDLIRCPGVFIVGAIRVRPHETHFSIGEALDTAAAVEASRVYITHISHEHSHREIEDLCVAYRETHGLMHIPMGPAYDGLELE
jgi:phosphoribosyl 1,2-cyclic phosphate phosphodiesterase